MLAVPAASESLYFAGHSMPDAISDFPTMIPVHVIVSVLKLLCPLPPLLLVKVKTASSPISSISFGSVNGSPTCEPDNVVAGVSLNMWLAVSKKASKSSSVIDGPPAKPAELAFSDDDGVKPNAVISMIRFIAAVALLMMSMVKMGVVCLPLLVESESGVEFEGTLLCKPASGLIVVKMELIAARS